MMNKISFNPFPTRKTERLTLRRLIPSDAEEVFFLRTDLKVNEYIQRPTPKNFVDADEFIKKINLGINQNKNIYWAITLNGSDKMIGAISLWHFSEDKTVAEVGYDLHPTHQNKGYMSEALTTVIKYGFNELGFKIITAYTHKDNKNSIKLLSKNGFNHVKGMIDTGNENNIIFSLARNID